MVRSVVASVSVGVPVILKLTTVVVVTNVLCIYVEEQLRTVIGSGGRSVARRLCNCSTKGERLRGRVGKEPGDRSSVGSFIRDGFTSSFVARRGRERVGSFFGPLCIRLDTLLGEVGVFSVASRGVASFVCRCRRVSGLIGRRGTRRRSEGVGTAGSFFSRVLGCPLSLRREGTVVSRRSGYLMMDDTNDNGASSVMKGIGCLARVGRMSPGGVLLVDCAGGTTTRLASEVSVRKLENCAFRGLTLSVVTERRGTGPDVYSGATSLFISVFRRLLRSRGFGRTVLMCFVSCRMRRASRRGELGRGHRGLTSVGSGEVGTMVPSVSNGPICMEDRRRGGLYFILSSLKLGFECRRTCRRRILSRCRDRCEPSFDVRCRGGNVRGQLCLRGFKISRRNVIPV